MRKWNALFTTLGVCALTATCDPWRGREAPSPFSRTTSVPVGANPVEIASGDVNGDSRLDLISIDAGDKTLTVLLGQGDGGFTAALGSPILTGAELHILTSADVDRDGDLDLLATGHDHAGVFVWLGHGNGGFTAAPGSPYLAHGPEVRAHNHGLAVGDVSGDSVPDAITANDGNGTISVLLGDGTGRFAPAPEAMIPVGDQPYFSALSDVDGDGFLDLLAPLIGQDALVMLRGDGAGRFAAAPGSPYPTLFRPYAVAIADLDDEGRKEVLIAHDDSDKLTILSASPGGGLSPVAGSPFSLGRRVFRMATADVNGDGAIDVAAGAGDCLLVFLAQRGAGFADGTRGTLCPGGWTVASGDFDRDGRPDLVAPDGAAGVLRLWMSSAR